MADKIYNWGIIGLGKIARKFAEDLGVIKNARIHAVASRSFDKAKAFAKEFNANYFFDSYEALMNCPDLDVIYIATPHGMHYENAMMCLKNKIPVLCEKPLAMNAFEVKEMIDLAKTNNTFFMEALWTRFLPSMKKVLELVQIGAIGEVVSVKADFGYRGNFDPQHRLFNQQLGGGALLDIGIYPVFLALLVLGIPKNIKAIATMGPTNVDESCGIIMKYHNNQMALLHATITSDTNTEAHIFGTKGSIQIYRRWHGPTSISLNLEGEEPKHFFFEYESKGYSYEARAVQKCLEKGQVQNGKMSWQFSMDLIKLLDAIRLEAGIYYPQDDRTNQTPHEKGGAAFSMN